MTVLAVFFDLMGMPESNMFNVIPSANFIPAELGIPNLNLTH